ncbi:hypothetical protein CEQ51_23650 [Pseudomonas thivervalensis]|uniref:Uncharacterized protein n=1 Tax=Pseudomonas thivervalensis TaxID=86265 RepID=A0A2Z4ZH06_9PSED|nr:hypothetical protein CE140_23100 [Pseudomonas thivervalensis]AXA62946.1 hypothetical protein CEQ51_23650 [Pseudomonas thivervalensis]
MIKDQKGAEWIAIGWTEPNVQPSAKPVARGFIPAGLRSSPKSKRLNQPGTPRYPVLGLLRSPAGINPLATRVQRMV